MDRGGVRKSDEMGPVVQRMANGRVAHRDTKRIKVSRVRHKTERGGYGGYICRMLGQSTVVKERSGMWTGKHRKCWPHIQTDAQQTPCPTSA